MRARPRTIGMLAALAPALAALALRPALLVAQVPTTALGLGYPVAPVDARAAALGGTGTALLDGSLTLRNPADATEFTESAFGLTVAPEGTDIVAPGATPDVDTGRGRFTVIRAVIPIGEWAFTAGFQSEFDQDWSLRVRDTLVVDTGTFPYEELREHDGGISAITLAGARRFGPVSLGVGYERLTGGLRQIFMRRFELDPDAGGLSAVEQRARWSYAGSRFRAGISAELDSLVRLGVAAAWTSELTAHREPVEGGEAIDPPVERRYDMPLSLDAGLSGRPVPTLLLTAAGGWTDWSEVAPALSEDAARDALWMGAGVEYSGIRVGGAPLVLRAGGRTGELPFFPRAGTPPAPSGVPAEDRQLTETAFSFGVGIEVVGGAAAFDLTAEIGERGELGRTGIEESFRRLYLTIALRQ